MGGPAFGSTLSEIIVPVLDPRSGAVIGTIDVESEHASAVSVRNQQLLEECARTALPLWVRNQVQRETPGKVAPL